MLFLEGVIKLLDEKLENESFHELLVKKDKIEPLEYLIDKNSKSLKMLHKKNLDYGPIPKKEEIPEIFQEVKGFVDKFLDVNITEPSCEYFSLFMKEHPYCEPLKAYGLAAFLFIGGLLVFPPVSLFSIFPFFKGAMMEADLNNHAYNYALEKIVLKKEKWASLVPIVAHEYDHHALFFLFGQNLRERDKYNEERKCFLEGHARGVQRAAAQHFSKKYNNKAFLGRKVDWDLGELKAAYKWVCYELKERPKKSLLETYSSKDRIEEKYTYYHFKPSPYAIGNSLLYIAEEKHGKDIFKKLLKGDTSFL